MHVLLDLLQLHIPFNNSTVNHVCIRRAFAPLAVYWTDALVTCVRFAFSLAKTNIVLLFDTCFWNLKLQNNIYLYVSYSIRVCSNNTSPEKYFKFKVSLIFYSFLTCTPLYMGYGNFDSWNESNNHSNHIQCYNLQVAQMITINLRFEVFYHYKAE